jgi:putative FmdB family regulatory protein
MPVYQYVCHACTRPFEELVFASDGPPSCPSCGAGDAERVLSVVTVGRSQAPAQALAKSFAGGGGCGSCGNAGGPGVCGLD